tara:strand:- start:899 stop:1120 length:222 start_codon:yes stop_codon:yes gene_type:complete
MVGTPAGVAVVDASVAAVVVIIMSTAEVVVAVVASVVVVVVIGGTVEGGARIGNSGHVVANFPPEAQWVSHLK